MADVLHQFTQNVSPTNVKVVHVTIVYGVFVISLSAFFGISNHLNSKRFAVDSRSLFNTDALHSLYGADLQYLSDHTSSPHVYCTKHMGVAGRSRDRDISKLS